MSAAAETRPKYLTDGSKLLEVYDATRPNRHDPAYKNGVYYCVDSSTEALETVDADDVGREKDDGKKWWEVTPALDGTA